MLGMKISSKIATKLKFVFCDSQHFSLEKKNNWKLDVAGLDNQKN